MRYLILLFLSIICLASYGQIPVTPQAQPAGNELRLLSSSSVKAINQKIFRAYNALYEHKGSRLAADSGDYYKEEDGREYFKAKGNIIITQPSGTVIFGDDLFYDAAAQQATLLYNVRMIDGETTLTTNHLTYNTGSQRGSYRNGGRIIGRQDTITSRNAYYFETTKDAYFRNKVVVRSPGAIIYTDSLQYNTMYRDAFFFGPTNINGRKGEKLYTERGKYNTAFGVAKFNKNNLYTEGSRFLKGDSLFYDREKGIGEAFRNVVFVDTLDKFYANGEYGKYLEADQSILMHTDPLIKYVVQSDSTGNADSTATDTIDRANLSPKEIRQLERDQEKLAKEKEKAEKERLKAAEKLEKERQKELAKNPELKTIEPPKQDSILAPTAKTNTRIDTAYMTADTIFSKVILVRDYKPLDLKLDRSGGKLQEDTDVDYGDEEDMDFNAAGDSIQENPQTAGEKILQDPKKPTTPAKTVQKKTTPKVSNSNPSTQNTVAVDPKQIQAISKADSILRRNAVIPTGNEPDSLMKKAMNSALKADTTVKDSTVMFSDTARTRIVNAYNNVRVFKSDLQAVADSVYYGMVDSMFRFMGKPMIWSDGSQISADTIFMQIKNNKMDNALLKENAFMVNAVLDTVKFNQLKGRKIVAFFANNNIERLFVTGNAEALVFNADDKTKIIKEMFHDRCSRIKIRMVDRKINDYVSERKVDQKLYPFKLVTQENEVLPGFIWKPQDRPKSVEDMMNRKRSKETVVPDQNGKDDPEQNSSDQNSKENPIQKSIENPTQKKVENPVQTKKEVENLEEEQNSSTNP
ncbi:OstA-like protein [Sphingobacterium sp. CZ-2]|uniref:OstA-like protein n=1 Tax=Sphingobacterium sp. CZ-2 TaxID=2557994 RepID=UPI001430BC9C|nr:OstA-like protein [Sphingobacterium sp. CZ-2]